MRRKWLIVSLSAITILTAVSSAFALDAAEKKGAKGTSPREVPGYD